jgi:hypothetical protein
MKGENMSNRNNNNAVECVAYVGRVTIPDAENYIANQTIEINSKGFPVLPALPIVGGLYILDFSKTCYKPILMHLDMVALELCSHFNMRTFLNGDEILITSPLSISEIEAAVEKVGSGVVRALRMLMQFPMYANPNKHMRPFHALAPSIFESNM